MGDGAEQVQQRRTQQSDGAQVRQAAEARERQIEEDERQRGEPAGERLRAEPIDSEYAMEMLRAIAEDVGSRFNGEPGERAMVTFMAEALREDGYEVAIEPFEFFKLDERHKINIVAGSGGADLTFSIPAVLMREGSSDSPASGPIVVVRGVGTADDFASVEAAGALVVVVGGELRYEAMQRNAEAAGAAALIVVNFRGPVGGGGNAPGEIPVFFVPGPLVELLSDNEGVTATISEPAEGELSESWNVVARRAGGVCRVVVGGHYDSVQHVQGANDNASGIAVMLALARAWAEAASAADVCFIGFGAEELGLHGSYAFVEAARESGELAEITAMVNLDAFGNGERPIIGVGSGGLPDLLERLGERLGIEVQNEQATPVASSDHAAFYDAGAPVIYFRTHGGILHVPADNVDNIDATLVRDVGLLAQAMLECLLERAGSRIEPRLSCDPVSP